MNRIETPVDGPTARRLLSPTGDPNRPMSRAMYSAILKAMGTPGARLVFVSQIVGFLKKNPNFRRSQIYPARQRDSLDAGRGKLDGSAGECGDANGGAARAAIERAAGASREEVLQTCS